jgi:hypothetical protein
MPFRRLSEAERAAVEVARTDPTARLCGGVGITQELSTGLYRLVAAPRDQSPAKGEVYINTSGHKERLVTYIGCNTAQKVRRSRSLPIAATSGWRRLSGWRHWITVWLGWL